MVFDIGILLYIPIQLFVSFWAITLIAIILKRISHASDAEFNPKPLLVIGISASPIVAVYTTVVWRYLSF